MSVPTLPEDHAVGEPERLHPLFLLNGVVGSLRNLGGAYAALAYFIFSGQWRLALFAAIAFVVVGTVGAIIYWRRFEYRVGANEIRIDSGILSRRHRSIPYDRIQDVDITQGPLARILGLAHVKFETGGGSDPKSEEGSLHAITVERAHEIRQLIRSRRTGVSQPAPATGTELRPVFAMDLKRLLIAGLFNFSLAVFAGLLGLSQTFGDAVGFDPLSERFWRSVLAASVPLQEFALAHRAIVVAAGSVLLLLLGAATGTIRTTLRDYGFRVDRTETGLRRRRGLVTRTDVTLPFRRAQAAAISSGPIREAFGWKEFSLKSLASDDGGRRAHVLAPLAHDSEIDHLLVELGWPPVPAGPTWQRVSKAYVWTFALALSPLLLPLAVQALVAWPAAIAFGSALLVAVTLRWLAWFGTAYALDDDRVLIRTGWWRRRLLILPFDRIQNADITENFMSRWFGTATVRLGVAGGSMAGEIIPAIPREAARQLRGDLLSSQP